MRGAAIMFCLLPPTRLALGHLPREVVPDASGLFNLMRNLGGAIGLALIDTVLYGRAPVHAERLIERLKAGDAGAAAAIGLPPELVAAQAGAPDPTALDFIFPLIEKAAFVEAIDEAWAMMAMLVALGLLTVPLLGTRVHGGERAPAVGPRSSLHPSIITGPQTRAAGAGKPAASDSGTAGRNGCLPGAVSDRALELA